MEIGVYHLTDFEKYEAVCTEVPQYLTSFLAKGDSGNSNTRAPRHNWRKTDRQLLQKSWVLTRQKPTDSDGETEVKEQVTGLLNKLSQKNFDEIRDQLLELEVSSKRQLEDMVEVIFYKAIREYSFTEIYTKLCKALIGCYIEEGAKKIFFRELLLSRCQTMFERCISTKETDEFTKDDLFSRKENVIGCIKLIGELYNFGMLTDSIIYGCFLNMNSHVHGEYRFIIESMCTLMDTVGKNLWKSHEEHCKKCLNMLDKIKGMDDIQSKDKFAIMDVLEKFT